jgi:hypothetical protein
MGVLDKFKSVGFGIGGFVFMLVLMAIPVMLLFGMTWVSMKVFPLLMPTFFWTLALCIVLLGPLSFLARTRGFAATGFMFCSYVFGAVLWMWALLLTYDLWGMMAVVIGILIAGVGIVPVALLAAVFHAEWAGLGDLVFMIVATFGFRFLAFWLASKADRERQGIYG